MLTGTEPWLMSPAPALAWKWTRSSWSPGLQWPVDRRGVRRHRRRWQLPRSTCSNPIADHEDLGHLVHEDHGRQPEYTERSEWDQDRDQAE